MESMFYGNEKFNQPLNNWNVSNVKNMYGMFAYSVFNQDISNWEINPDCTIQGMFKGGDIEENFKPNRWLKK